MSVSCYWIPYVIACLKALLQQATWNSTDPAVIQLAIERSQRLIDQFMTAINSSGCDGLLPPIACSYFFPLSPYSWTLDDQTPNTPPFWGQWVPGIGWFSTQSSGFGRTLDAVDIILAFPFPVHLNTVTMQYEKHTGSAERPLGETSGIILYSPGFASVVGRRDPDWRSLPDGTNDWTLTGDFPNVQYVRLLLIAAISTGSLIPGDGRIIQCNINGLGSGCP